MSSLRERMMRLRGASSQNEQPDAKQPASGGDSQTLVRSETDEHHQDGRTDHSEFHAEKHPEVAHVPGPDEEKLSPEWADMRVRLAKTEEGEFLLRETRYPMTYLHGVHRLDELYESVMGLASFELWSEAKSAGARRVTPGTPISPVHPERMLFFDLETTGLGVGAGNVPFMVGLGFVQGDQFVVEQMLIRHPAEERAMLCYLTNKLHAYTHLVTYNGRTFDWPVLSNRLILNGFRTFRWEPIHIDLLHPSRSVWRNTLASCKLSHIEEERLGITRVDDVPGSMAPGIYFQYLAEQDPKPLLGVFTHNEIDMVSLAVLAIRFGHLLGGELGRRVPYPEGAEETLRTGLWLERMGMTDAAEALYARLEHHPAAASQILCSLAERDKKCGNWPRAVLLWQKVVLEEEGALHPNWDAHIELAMYHEHKTKQIRFALSYAETALTLAHTRWAGLRLDAKKRAELDAIRKRIDRLRARLERLHG
ncbi:hypothetical protein FHS18_002422 [Paenibacillus phyllosphaerae]|uniref:YprB ribonuclease H-like domain-containing protein n=1 Tax=Paenibacillus phyllosphaerae TaxID=274593 RepID=A0A7W5AX06_9BACL|nr:ribonuclease H-like domain-containing protein [Paenibacillus phyllosphaerae]MBB3110355.1 hypothetical protein [Paenibacillus phyllosphaerae]